MYLITVMHVLWNGFCAEGEEGGPWVLGGLRGINSFGDSDDLGTVVVVIVVS